MSILLVLERIMQGYARHSLSASLIVCAIIWTTSEAHAQIWDAYPKSSGEPCTLSVVDTGYLLVFSFGHEGGVTIAYNDDKLRSAPEGPTTLTMTLKRKADGSVISFPIEGSLSKTDHGPLFGAIVRGEGKDDPFANAMVTVLERSSNLMLGTQTSRMLRSVPMTEASEDLAIAKACIRTDTH